MLAKRLASTAFRDASRRIGFVSLIMFNLLQPHGPMSTHAKLFLTLGALSASASVLVGASLSHLASAGAAASLSTLQTALNLHQFHALGLLLVGLLARPAHPSRWLTGAGGLMFAGTLLFSVNLYLRGFFGIDAFRVAVPWGGAAYLLAWLALAAACLFHKGD
jgi:uncharacterized membrane protein YgdD (TMEM256/DUF423 family)